MSTPSSFTFDLIHWKSGNQVCGRVLSGRFVGKVATAPDLHSLIGRVLLNAMTTLTSGPVAIRGLLRVEEGHGRAGGDESMSRSRFDREAAKLGYPAYHREA